MDANEIIFELITLNEHVKSLHFKASKLVAYKSQASRNIKDAVEALTRIVDSNEL